MSDPHKAVFLSYASQDAEAARRICDALRAAGIEVWFDQSELRGGDSWDAKIRKQIKDCTLFVPVISANTQARLEGYFRLEWKLAAQRTHTMADAKPFLLPVVIDATRDAEAHVPEEFRTVQWTRLSAKDTPATLANHVGKLLAIGREQATAAEVTRDPPALFTRRRRPGWLRFGWAGVGIALALVYGLRPFWQPGRDAKPAAPSPTAGNPAPTVSVEAEQLVLRARSRHIESRDELVVALDQAKRATTLAPDSARAWGVRAYLQSQFIQRGWDIGPQQRQQTQADANHALAIDRNVTDAMFALAVVLEHQGAYAEAEGLMRRAIVIDPQVAALHQALGVALSGQGRESEALAVRQETLRLFPQDPLAHYDLALSYENAPVPDFDTALRKFDDSLALQPFTSTLLHKASILAGGKGDLPAAQRLLEGLNPLELTGDRAVGLAMLLGLLEHRPDRTLEAGGRTARTYLEDEYVRGPKAWLLAHAYAMNGKQNLAEGQWRNAESLLRERARSAPEDWFNQAGLGLTLAWLGRADEAASIMAPLESVARESPQSLRALYLAYYHAGLGDAAGTVDWLQRILNRRELVTAKTLPLDPWWNKVRDDTRFQALGAAPLGNIATAPLSEGGQLAARALTLITKIGFTRDDLGPAEDFALRATELEPDSAATWGVRAGVQAAWLFRGWDNSEKRRQDTQSFANHALALDPNEPEALLALGHVLRNQGAFDQAAEHLRRAVAANPTHIRLARALGYTLSGHGRDTEARAVLLNVVQRAPRDPLLRYELALTYISYASVGAIEENLAGALEQLDTAIAIQPFSSALILKAALIGGWRGDLPAMHAVLDQVEQLSLAERSEDRSVCIAMWAGLLEHRADRTEAAAALTARNYFDDFVMPMRPKAWSLALAHRLAGKENLARADWHAAEAVLRQRVKADPTNSTYQVELAVTLAWLDQRDEAARLIEPIEPVWMEEFKVGRTGLLAMYYAGLGNAAKVAVHLAPEIDRMVFTSRKVLPLDPRWDKVRGQPAFDALLKIAPTNP